MFVYLILAKVQCCNLENEVTRPKNYKATFTWLDQVLVDKKPLLAGDL